MLFHPSHQTAARQAIRAVVALFVLLLLSRKLQVMNRRGHLICLAQGLCLFCVNFMCFLTASQWVTTGLIAVVFFTAVLPRRYAAMRGAAYFCTVWGLVEAVHGYMLLFGYPEGLNVLMRLVPLGMDGMGFFLFLEVLHHAFKKCVRVFHWRECGGW